jgi:hypothetical protein
MADKSNPGQTNNYEGCFSGPFNPGPVKNDPIGAGGVAKPYDYGNATKDFDTPSNYSKPGGGIIVGAGTINSGT